MSNQVKKILFTFDYELFLGKKSGDVENCLITPTNRVMAILDKHNLKAIFFVDSYFLVRLSQLKNSKAVNDFIQIKEQLIGLLKKGHYVFPHLHPHWLDAVYLEENNQWDLSNITKYRFDQLSENQKEKLFEESMQLLSELILPSFPSYKFDGYRAGGWSIQPFSNFKPFFEQYNFKYDFSVLPDEKAITTAQSYDFTNAPIRPIYQFTEDICVEEVNGKFTEFSISSIKFSWAIKIFNKLLEKYLWKIGDKAFGSGLSVSSNTIELKSSGGEMLSIELLNLAKLATYKRFIDGHNFVHFISHPKMFTKHGLRIFEKLVNYIQGRYEVESDFKKFLNNGN